MACLTHRGQFTRRRPNLKSLPHKSFAKEEAQWPSMGSAAPSAKTCFAPCWTRLVETAPCRYRHLFWETGMIGQILYLEAEAQGVRATGIGCFFDDPVHELMGLPDDTFRSLYHFTVGGPREDARLATRAAYHHLEAPVR